MSRIGRAPIELPNGVTLDVTTENDVIVTGPKGTLRQTIASSDVKVEKTTNEAGKTVITLTRANDEKENRAKHGLYRALFQLKEAGWFKYTKGFIIGRNRSNFEPLGYTFKQALIDGLSELNVPVIYDADISHKSPSLPILNGSIATISYKDNKGSIKFELK